MVRHVLNAFQLCFKQSFKHDKNLNLFDCFYFSYRYFQVPKIASNLDQFGARYQKGELAFCIRLLQ